MFRDFTPITLIASMQNVLVIHVATAPIADAAIARIRDAFFAVHEQPSPAVAREALLLERFVVPDPSVYGVQRERAQEVERSGVAWP